MANSSYTRKTGNGSNKTLIAALGGVIVVLLGLLGYMYFLNMPQQEEKPEIADTSGYSPEQMDSLLSLRMDSMASMLTVDTIFQKSTDSQSSMTKGEIWWCNLPDTWKKVLRSKMAINDDVFPTNQQIANLSASLKELTLAGNKEITSLKPLAMLPNIEKLDCSNSQINDLSPIASLTKLRELSFANTQISDLSPLASLTSLRVLSFPNAKVASLAPLKGLEYLEKLDCSINYITDLNPIKDLSLIADLNCANNNLSTMKPISDLINIKVLNCSGTKVGNLMPLFNLAQLQVLYCFDTKVGSLDPLYNLDNLRILYYNNIEEKIIDEFKSAMPECTVLLRKK